MCAIMKEDEQAKGLDALLFDGIPNNLNDDKNNMLPRPTGFIGYPQAPQVPNNLEPFNYPQVYSPPPSAPGYPPLETNSNIPPAAKIPPAAFSYNIPPTFEASSVNDSYSKPINVQPYPPAPFVGSSLNDSSTVADKNKQSNVLPKPAPRSKITPSDNLLPELPAVPSDEVVPNDDNSTNYSYHDDNDIDFDDITRRFEELKKKKK